MGDQSNSGGERPSHPDLRRLLDYWNGKRGDRDFPTRADLDPVDLGFMLDRIALTEVHQGEKRFRLRLVGSWWGMLTGRELTGKWMDDWPEANLRKLTIATYDKLIAARRPMLETRNAWVDKRKLDYEILLLPLSEDGVRISMVVTGIGPSQI